MENIGQFYSLVEVSCNCVGREILLNSTGKNKSSERSGEKKKVYVYGVFCVLCVFIITQEVIQKQRQNGGALKDNGQGDT